MRVTNDMQASPNGSGEGPDLAARSFFLRRPKNPEAPYTHIPLHPFSHFPYHLFDCTPPHTFPQRNEFSTRLIP